MSGARKSERGAALLIVTVAVAVLTALAADLAYEARVSLQIAANSRNELQATYLARSGLALGRLVLSFQRQIDDMKPPVQGVAIPRIQIWKLAPIGPELADALMGGAPPTLPSPGAAPALGGAGSAFPPAAPAAAAAAPARGTFDVAIDDEGRKVNFQLDALQDGAAAQVQAIWQLVCDPKWDPLFDREDANGQRVSRTDLLVYLRDWVSQDPASSALAQGFAPIGCAVVVPTKPFESGFGDKNFPYDRGEDRYRTKNARMDSLDELYLVAGIGDAFMAAFRDHVTVYLARDDKQNVNTTDPAELRRIAFLMADPPDQAKLADPLFLVALHKAILERTLGGVLTITPIEFSQLLQGLGLTVNQGLVTSSSSTFTDSSTVFRLRSTAREGDVTKTLDVVLRVDKPQGVVVTPGKILHWREE